MMNTNIHLIFFLPLYVQWIPKFHASIQHHFLDVEVACPENQIPLVIMQNKESWLVLTHANEFALIVLWWHDTDNRTKFGFVPEHK